MQRGQCKVKKYTMECFILSVYQFLQCLLTQTPGDRDCDHIDFYFFPSPSISMAMLSSLSWQKPQPKPISPGSIQCLISWMLTRLSRSGSRILFWFLYSRTQTSNEKRTEKTPAPARTGPATYSFLLMKHRGGCQYWEENIRYFVRIGLKTGSSPTPNNL